MFFNNTKNIDEVLKHQVVRDKLWEQDINTLLLPWTSYELYKYTFTLNYLDGKSVKWTVADLVTGLRRQFDALASNYRGRASYKGWDCSITGKQLFQKWIEQHGKCVKTQRLMQFTSGTSQEKNPHKISLDRIDNNIAYHEANVRFLTHFYNNAKSTWGDVLVDNYMADAHNVVLQETVFNVPV
jgi:hypothetical protein